MKNVFRKSNADKLGTSQVIQSLQDSLRGRAPVVDATTAKSVIAMESLSDSSSDTLASALSNFNSLLKGAASTAGLSTLSIAQEEAAGIASVLGSSPYDYTRRAAHSQEAIRQAAASSGNTATVVIGGESAERISMEAFDERPNANAMIFSAAYNMQSAKQNEFGEAFYPTVTVTPDQVGFSVNLRLILAYSEVSRAASGALSNFNRKNIIRAIIDSSVLAVDQTRLIPVYRSSGGNDSSANFVSVINTTVLHVDNADLPTRPLAVGKKFSILGISQTDAALAAGQQDQTDAVDSSARLSAIYVSVAKGDGGSPETFTYEYFKFDTENLPTSDFNLAPQGNTRLLTLHFATKAIRFTSATKTVAGASSTFLSPLGTNTVRMNIALNGEITQDLGDTIVQALPVTVEAVNDSSGAALSTSSGAGQTAATALGMVTVIGYDLLAYRTNSNRRNRGKLLDIQHVNYLYTMPLLPPITALRPVASQEQDDGNMLSTLVTATRIQTSNAAVTALLNTQSTLQAFSTMDAETVLNQPTLFGVSALMVTPAYLSDSIDCSADLDSLNANTRIADLQALLINKIRNMAILLYVQSGYGPALQAQYEGTPPKITVIIGADPQVARYLQLAGDTRLMGDQFDFKVVESFDARMMGKVFFSFGLESAFNSGVVNPLHFGNMGWKPELTLMLPMVRNGANIMELTVQPSYRHVTNLPILGALTVTHLDDVVGGKVTVNVSQ